MIKPFFRGFKKGFNMFGETIATLVNSVLLFIVYVVGIGLTSLAAKLVKKRFLELKIEKDKESYWSDLNLKKEKIEKYYRQF